MAANSRLDVSTESDVEQKLLWGFLTDIAYLSIPAGQIATKKYLPKRDLGKGSSARSGYSPDYLIYANRLPCLVVEAKAPNERAEQAYSEARLYANEVNSSHPTGINPIRYVIGCNGVQLLFGPVDAGPSVEWVMGSELVPGPASAEIVRVAAWGSLQAIADETLAQIERKRYYTPVYLFGGQQRLDVRLGQNSMSEAIAPIIRRYFDSETPEAKAEILEKAYIDSESTTRYTRYFENFLRDRLLPSNVPSAASLEPQRRSEPQFAAALGAYQSSLPATGAIQLVIGAVGAGKSMFLERFEKYLLPEESRERLFWSYLNFNEAPSDATLLENWLCERFVQQFKEVYFKGDPTIQFAVFADRKRDFDFANFLIKDSDPYEYNRRLSIELSDWARDPKIFASAACRYLIGDRRIGVVCVFDNVDRRDRDQQLRIFQIAQWFKSETRACCVIALRGATYERYKREPPLDAFIHSNHFYIEAPRFIDIVRKRLQLSLEAMKGIGDRRTSIRGLGEVVIPERRVSSFLDSLFHQLFMAPQRRAAWIVEGLSGRSARAALAMFARLIYSPHMDERHLIRAGASVGGLDIPDRAILNALMKTDYLFFSEEHGFVSNLFDFDPDTRTSDNLIRLEIVNFLVHNRKMRGDIGVEGYFFASTLCERLKHMGYDLRDVLREIDWGIRRGLITADHFGDRPVVETDAIKATAAAYIRTGILLEQVDYLANAALTIKVFDREVAERIAEIWNLSGNATDINLTKKQDLAKLMCDYLAVQASRRGNLFPLGNEASQAPAMVRKAAEAVQRFVDRKAKPSTLL